MLDLILYGFIVWHICCFIMNIISKDAMTPLRVLRALVVMLLLGKVIGEWMMVLIN